MGRAPCCEKMGLKKGPWSPKEDQILISYIQEHGHPNWRALPKHAGLLRCGKSCRLRWVNYLNPDVKRGQFTSEEEDTIIKLHEELGNRWSAIAARLPGRTDNEIKNVWNTHLKKRLNKHQTPQEKPKKKIKSPKNEEQNGSKVSEESDGYFPAGSPQQSTAATEISTTTEDSCLLESFPEMDESFWTESLSTDDFEIVLPDNVDQPESYGLRQEDRFGDGGVLDEEMEFWFNVFIQAGGSQELPGF